MTPEQAKMRALRKALASEWGYVDFEALSKKSQAAFTHAAIAALEILEQELEPGA